MAALTGKQEPLYEAFAARALATATPGFVSSWGTPLGVSNVSAAELRRLHREAMQGARLTVSIAVDANPSEVARFAARRVAQLETGEPASALPPSGESSALIGEQLAVPSLRVIVGLRAEGDAHASLAPAVVASALGKVLSQRVGEIVWQRGRGNLTFGFSAVAIASTEQSLLGLESVVADALRELGQRSDGVWASALRTAAFERSAQRSDVSGWIEMAFDAAERSPKAEDELEAVKRLLRAAPHFAVLRPRP